MITIKSTGIVRKIGNLGRIVIPKELRKKMNIKKQDPMEIFVEGDYIILTKYSAGCMYCGEITRTFQYRGSTICYECQEEMQEFVQR